jgi:hypothetical protein
VTDTELQTDMENPLLRHAPRQVGLIDLFMMIVFIMPACAGVARVKHSGGGNFAYLLALPPGVALGFAIVSVEWKLGKAIWRRFSGRWRSIQNFVGILLFAFQLFWIFVGLVSGDMTGALVASQFPR